MSSVVGLLGSAGQANYAASKAGLVGLARSLARELGSRRITVNVVAPGPVATDMTAALGEKRLAELTAAVPLGRMATARRDRRCGRVPRLGRRRLHHRCGDPRRRRPRHGPLTPTAPPESFIRSATSRRSSQWIKNCSPASASAPSRCSRVSEDQVVPDAKFGDDLDADSLDLVELVMALEEEFGVEVPEEDLEGIETVGQAYDLVVAKLWDERDAAAASPSPGTGSSPRAGIGRDAFWTGLLGPGVSRQTSVTGSTDWDPSPYYDNAEGGAARRPGRAVRDRRGDRGARAGRRLPTPTRPHRHDLRHRRRRPAHARGADPGPARQGRAAGLAVPRPDDDGQRLRVPRSRCATGCRGRTRRSSPPARPSTHAIGYAARLIAWGMVRRGGHRRLGGGGDADVDRRRSAT